MTPFIAKELWGFIGHKNEILAEPSPNHDENPLDQDETTIVVQANGNLRDQIMVPTEISTDKAELEKRGLEILENQLGGKAVRKLNCGAGEISECAGLSLSELKLVR